mgnify:CR=1 FL=1
MPFKDESVWLWTQGNPTKVYTDITKKTRFFGLRPKQGFKCFIGANSSNTIKNGVIVDLLFGTDSVNLTTFELANRSVKTLLEHVRIALAIEATTHRETIGGFYLGFDAIAEYLAKTTEELTLTYRNGYVRVLLTFSELRPLRTRLPFLEVNNFFKKM